MKSKTSGFTLVEIMVVVAIIAMLAGLVIPGMMRARITSNEANSQATLRAISNALESYAAGNNSIFPSSTNLLLGATPPYLNVDYFAGPYKGFTYTAVISSYTYTVTAVPISSAYGLSSYSVRTGAVLTQN